MDGAFSLQYEHVGSVAFDSERNKGISTIILDEAKRCF